MKKTSYIFEKIREYLQSPEFISVCKLAKTHFVRQRQLSSKILVLFILNLLRKSIANELISFMKTVEIGPITRSAISKARLKLSPKAFICMNHVLLSEFYTDNPVKCYGEFVVFAIDGSTLELPLNSSGILQRYGGATNQTDQMVPMARTSVLFDVINGITVDAIIDSYLTAERDMAFQHIENLKKYQLLQKSKNQFLILFDRGYPSIPLVVYLQKQGIQFLMRCNSKFIKEVDEAVAQGKQDVVIEFNLKRAGNAGILLENLFPGLNKNETAFLRVIVLNLKTGEREILITSLHDQEKYPYTMFHDLYFKRWGVEENYKFQKGHLSVENFSGKSCQAIEQDFHATVLTSNAQALLALEAEGELETSTDATPRKYKYKINRSVGVSSLKNEFIKVLKDPTACLESFCEGIKQIMKSNLIPLRPGRRFKRVKKHPHRKWHMNLR